jgi:hypothetical protein
MTYDTKCYELAKHFLQDGPFKGHEPAAANLAEAIQQAIEDWFIYNRNHSARAPVMDLGDDGRAQHRERVDRSRG